MTPRTISSTVKFPSFLHPSSQTDFWSLAVHRVRQTALKLASQLSDHNPDLLALELAAVFHDLLDKKYRPSNHVEGDVSTYDFFLPFFEQNVHIVDMVSSGQAELIVKIVDNVSWSTETALIKSGGLTDWHKECIELHCVQDADRLDAMGAIGMSFDFLLWL